MRPLAALIVIIIALLPAARNEQKAHPQGQKESAQNAPSQTTPVTVVINQPTSPYKQERPDKKTHDWYDYALVIAAIIAAFIGFRSLHQVKRQAKATEDAANAANTNALAVINAERAWVMVDVDFRPGFGLTKITSADTVHTAASIELRVQNCGPTPAWIFEQWVRLEVAGFVVASKTEYPSPQFPHIGEGKICSVNYSILPMVKGQEPAKWTTDVSDEGWATEDNGLYTHIYGLVRYRDAFSSLRETYFGYSVWHSKLERMPSEAYNHHT